MKRKIVALLLCTAVAMTMIGCGNKTNDSANGTESVSDTESAVEEGTETTSSGYVSMDFGINEADYVTLCDYSAIELTLEGDYTIEDADVEEFFAEWFYYYGPFFAEDTTKTTIEEGDIVNVDYVGKLDGVAFEGGTAESQLIDVYNNCSADGYSGYIDGFTEGLKGASVGDVIDCDVTFPAEYQNADLAGQAVVFTFTVNSIQKEITLEDVDDSFAVENLGVDTLDEAYAQMRAYLEADAESSKESDTYTAIQDYLLDNCTVEVPQEYMDARLHNLKQQFIVANCGGDASQLESYLSMYYGLTEEEADEQWREMLDESIRIEFIVEAIAAKDGVEADEEGFTSYVDGIVSGNGYESAEALYELYGYGDTAWGKEYFKTLYKGNAILEEIKENAIVTVAAAEDTGAAEETETEETGTEETGTEK